MGVLRLGEMSGRELDDGRGNRAAPFSHSGEMAVGLGHIVGVPRSVPGI